MSLERAKELVRIHKDGTMVSARELVQAIEFLIKMEAENKPRIKSLTEELPGYIGVTDQARAYLAGEREYDPQTMRWMIAGLLR